MDRDSGTAPYALRYLLVYACKVDFRVDHIGCIFKKVDTDTSPHRLFIINC